MFIEERHRDILAMLERDGRVSVDDLREKFGISQDSARRDLRLMEEKGLLKRTHGGAIPLGKVNALPPRERDMVSMEIKPNYDAIAARAAAMVGKGDVIYLNSGSTGFLMLRHLPRDIEYTVVVNSATLADQMKYWDNIKLFITGGQVRMHGTTSIVDAFAVNFIRAMKFDLCFLTGAGLTAEFGLSNGTAETAEFQRAVIAQSRRKILLIPGAKVGFSAFIRVCGADCFDTIITDSDAVEDELTAIDELGVEIITTGETQS